MKIGIDLDGVVIDSEQTFRVYEEIFDIENISLPESFWSVINVC